MKRYLEISVRKDFEVQPYDQSKRNYGRGEKFLIVSNRRDPRELARELPHDINVSRFYLTAPVNLQIETEYLPNQGASSARMSAIVDFPSQYYQDVRNALSEAYQKFDALMDESTFHLNYHNRSFLEIIFGFGRSQIENEARRRTAQVLHDTGHNSGTGHDAFEDRVIRRRIHFSDTMQKLSGHIENRWK